MPDNQDKQSNFERTKELTDKLEAGMKELVNSDKYKDYLTAMSKLHGYSSRNVMLINQQFPGATRPGSFKTWEELNRHVKKGEHAIWIWAPIAEKKPETKLLCSLGIMNSSAGLKRLRRITGQVWQPKRFYALYPKTSTRDYTTIYGTKAYRPSSHRVRFRQAATSHVLNRHSGWNGSVID